MRSIIVAALVIVSTSVSAQQSTQPTQPVLVPQQFVPVVITYQRWLEMSAEFDRHLWPPETYRAITGLFAKWEEEAARNNTGDKK